MVGLNCTPELEIHFALVISCYMNLCDFVVFQSSLQIPVSVNSPNSDSLA